MLIRVIVEDERGEPTGGFVFDADVAVIEEHAGSYGLSATDDHGNLLKIAVGRHGGEFQFERATWAGPGL